MNSLSLNDFCSRWLSAWTGNQPEKLIQFYSDDAYYRDPAQADGMRGKTALFEYFSKLLRKNPDWVWSAKEIIPPAKVSILTGYRWRSIPVTLKCPGIVLSAIPKRKQQSSFYSFGPSGRVRCRLRPPKTG